MDFLCKRLLRRPILSLLRIVLGAVLCLLVCLLLRHQSEQEIRLREIQSSFEILCIVTNRRGTQSESLRMPPLTLSALTLDSSPLRPHIRDLRLTKEFEYSALALGVNAGLLRGVTNERCAEDLDPARGGELQLLREDFFTSTEPLLLLSRELYERMDGEQVTLTVTDPYIDRRVSPELGVGTLEARVAGWYAGSGETVYFPYPAAEALAYELSRRVSCDAAAFLAADNTKLDELRQAASGSFGPVDPQAGPDADPRYALLLHDEGYRTTLAVTEQNLRQVRVLLPAAILLILAEGFLLCFLSTRGEEKRYALMRTLGQSRSRLLAGMLAEQLLPPLPAALVVGVLLGLLLPVAVFMICHTAGCLAAAARTLRVRPAVLLRNTEE